MYSIFAGLFALDTISGGAVAIEKTVTDAKSAQQQLEEAQRQNRQTEAIAIGGKGLSLQTYRRGFRLLMT